MIYIYISVFSHQLAPAVFREPFLTRSGHLCLRPDDDHHPVPCDARLGEILRKGKCQPTKKGDLTLW